MNSEVYGKTADIVIYGDLAEYTKNDLEITERLKKALEQLDYEVREAAGGNILIVGGSDGGTLSDLPTFNIEKTNIDYTAPLIEPFNPFLYKMKLTNKQKRARNSSIRARKARRLQRGL